MRSSSVVISVPEGATCGRCKQPWTQHEEKCHFAAMTSLRKGEKVVPCRKCKMTFILDHFEDAIGEAIMDGGPESSTFTEQVVRVKCPNCEETVMLAVSGYLDPGYPDVNVEELLAVGDEDSCEHCFESTLDENTGEERDCACIRRDKKQRAEWAEHAANEACIVAMMTEADWWRLPACPAIPGEMRAPTAYGLSQMVRAVLEKANREREVADPKGKRCNCHVHEDPAQRLVYLNPTCCIMHIKDAVEQGFTMAPHEWERVTSKAAMLVARRMMREPNMLVKADRPEETYRFALNVDFSVYPPRVKFEEDAAYSEKPWYEKEETA